MTIRAISAEGSREARFIAAIQRMIRDPGTRAALRRGLGRPPGRAPQMHAVVAPWLPGDPTRSLRPAVERAYYAVAALMAHQPRTSAGLRTDAEEPEAPPNLGASFAEAVRTGRMREDTSATRLHLLCRQGVDGIHRHLPRAVTQLQVAGVQIAWERLLKDLADWDRDRDEIAKRWLQSYYRRLQLHPDRDSTPTAAASSPEGDPQ